MSVPRYVLATLSLLLLTACGRTSGDVFAGRPLGAAGVPGNPAGGNGPPEDTFEVAAGFEGFVTRVDVAAGTDQPLEGATVTALEAEGQPSATVLTDASGQFVLDVPEGLRWVHATAPGHWGQADAFYAPSPVFLEPLLPDDHPSFAAIRLAAGEPAPEQDKGMVDVLILSYERSSLPAGITVALGTASSGVPLLRGEATFSKLEGPLPEAATHQLLIAGVLPGYTSVDVQAPEGLSCETLLPPAGLFVAPKTFTRLYVECN